MGRSSDSQRKAQGMQALQAGASLQAVCTQFGVSEWVAAKWRRELVRQGLVPPSRGLVPPSPRRAAVEAALLAGLESRADIAARCGVTLSAVNKWARQLIAAGRLQSPRRPATLPAVAELHLKERWEPCLWCGTPFRYRYLGQGRGERLAPIERLCPTCFTHFCERQHLALLPTNPGHRRSERHDAEDEGGADDPLAN